MTLVFLVAILAGILSAITETINKNITEKRYSVFSYAFVQWAGACLLYSIPFVLWGSLPRQIPAYIYLLLVVTVVFIGNISLIKAYKTEDISNISILSQISLVIAFVLGIAFLREPFSGYKITGVGTIIAGIVVIFYEGKKINLTPAYLLSLIAGILFGLTSYLDKRALAYFDIFSFLFIYNLLSSIMLVFIPNTLVDLKPILKKYLWKIVLSRLAVFIGFYLLMWSIRGGNISVVNTNYQISFLLSTTLIGIIFLRERKFIAKKLIGSAFCTLGIALLNFF